LLWHNYYKIIYLNYSILSDWLHIVNYAYPSITTA
jgi:hypothetical protein